MKLQVSLSEKEVQEILEEYLAKKFKKVGEVHLEVGKQLKGHYTGEHYETVFKQATCEVEV
ncbi:hypothetical protein CPT_Moonbeam22 [Bacillus phage Moonbeam]|uniref:Uncharacterized protein n=1 Tax=Bacillus phage Moonbeam TaxID=1540091 RepID=A0A0A0RMX5_9CAUD|nr:hypothetical protein CPT_Moonbeam22 [Bacillus phage Moonbeam]AIW03420.1 hypothetical protein CPT_Moonbeam22 [Bacillus phage Moonbeam]